MQKNRTGAARQDVVTPGVATPGVEQRKSADLEIYECRLLDAFLAHRLNKPILGELAQYLRKMSGHYDQAARAATSF